MRSPYRPETLKPPFGDPSWQRPSADHCVDLALESDRLTERGQYVFVDAVEAYLRDLDFDPASGMASKWWPQGRAGLVVVDPRIGFGAPHVAEIAVSTAAVYDLVEAGESLSSAAEWFGLTPSQAEAAITFERNLQAA